LGHRPGARLVDQTGSGSALQLDAGLTGASLDLASPLTHAPDHRRKSGSRAPSPLGAWMKRRLLLRMPPVIRSFSGYCGLSFVCDCGISGKSLSFCPVPQKKGGEGRRRRPGVAAIL
jgi:hypothetical protein